MLLLYLLLLGISTCNQCPSLTDSRRHFSGFEATCRSGDSNSSSAQSVVLKMGENRRTIRIPLEPHSVVIFPDELPVGDLDYNDIIDILRSVLAPLKLWRSCAVEYHRQGFRVEFDQVLSEIIDSLADPCKQQKTDCLNTLLLSRDCSSNYFTCNLRSC